MPRKISKYRCKRCVHYRGWYCNLDDLSPCRFVERPGVKHIRPSTAALIALLIVVVILSIFGCARTEEPVAPEYHWSAVELLRNRHKGELTEFDKLTLAIALTESKFHADADSGEGDYGLFQLREIYIDEVNRIAGTSYTIEDAFDIDKSIEIFRTMQLFKNPGQNLEQACYYHNKSKEYLNTVMRNYKLICRAEEVRAKLIER